ncbi:hypothetical protein BGZ97_004475 [Linnemannia gamsii]|jgi:hypothetical protein|uniref:Uncharacterized protein n=1 Tax=Linnemannia gamsii TaxID=64522 RepID=A0A9P6URU3_9FUNG|nr:hypothetical protein BGZ97_004475 [Linnemannia gamsii]
MFIKTTTLTLLALLATSVTAQQMPKHTAFTDPVDGSEIYTSGQNATFSWTMACKKPSTAVSIGPSSAVEVQLVNSNNPENAFFVARATYIDCGSKDSGNENWVVPEVPDNQANYSLRIMLNNPVYSGKFKIQAQAGTGGSGNGGGQTVTDDKQTDKNNGNAAGSLVVSAVSAVVASTAAALLLL